MYDIQKLNFNRQDWCSTVQNDLIFYDISLSELEIGKMSKAAFKKLVVRQINRKSFSEMKSSNKSKIQNILKSVQIDKNFKIPMQPYLKSQILTTVEKQHLFSLRNRSYNLKSNYKTLYDNDMSCRICLGENSTEDEVHTFEQCYELIEHNVSEIKFIQIFGSLEEQIHAIKYFTKIIVKRNLILEIKNMR